MKKSAKNVNNVKGDILRLLYLNLKLDLIRHIHSIIIISQKQKKNYFREQREAREREREKEKEQREKEQRELLEKERERERHFAAQMYAAEMQRNLFLSGFHATQRSPLGLGLGFPPGVPSLPPHMAGHPFSHMAAMAGVAGMPSLSHTSPIPSSYNAPSSSLNLSSQSRNHVTSSPVGGGGTGASGDNSATHSSNIPSIQKHGNYLPPHKTDPKQKHPISGAPSTSAHDASMYVSSERHANSSNNRNSSNHNSANSHLNVEQQQQQSKSVPKSMAESIYAMQRESHRTQSRASYAGDATAPAECKYSISLERINSNLVTSNESRNEPMELSVSSDATHKQQQQAKFNPEQISPKKRQLIGSDSNIKSIHQNDEFKNGCQERSNEAKDLSGRSYSLYDAMGHYQQPATSTAATIDLRGDRSNANANDSLHHHQMPYGNHADRQRSVVQSPKTISKEQILSNTNTRMEYDSTINKDNKLSKNNISGDVEPLNAAASIMATSPTASASTENETNNWKENKSITPPNTSPAVVTAATTATALTTTTATTMSTITKSPSKNNTNEIIDIREKSPPNSIETSKPSDTLDATARDSEHHRESSTDKIEKDSMDGTAVSVENVELAKQPKS